VEARPIRLGELCLWRVLLSISILRGKKKKKQLIYNSILVSGIQHCDSVFFIDYTPLKVITK